MRILFVRVRIGVQESGYSYRLYIPFTESSFERQALISVHSDFGRGLARAYASCGCDRETVGAVRCPLRRSEEHTSELQSLMRISYAVFCLKKKTQKESNESHTLHNITIHINRNQTSNSS